jgi:ribose transport system permease protein
MIAIIGAGMTVVIISGGIDLAVGSIVLLCGVLLAGALAAGWSVPLAIAGAIGAGAAAGLVSGVGVAYLRMPPFVMTLAAMTMYHGAAFIYARGQPIRIPSAANATLGPIANSYIGNVVPIPVLYVLVVYLATYVLLAHTRLGVHVYAVGGNEEAARLSGVNVTVTKLLVYIISGIASAIAAVILTSRAGTGEILAGMGYELDAIAAVAIGGTSLAGGRGGVWGTLAGTLILFILLNIFTMLNVPSHYQEVFKGLIIVIAVLVQFNRGRR